MKPLNSSKANVADHYVKRVCGRQPRLNLLPEARYAGDISTRNSGRLRGEKHLFV